jgi:hypothetical protein
MFLLKYLNIKKQSGARFGPAHLWRGAGSKA